MQKGQINSLTGFRAFAAGIVLIGHLVDHHNPNTYWFLKFGWVGVNFFFALSGFLFTILYFDKFANQTQSFKEYFLKRIFRIYPMYLLLLGVTVLTRMIYSWQDILTHLFMVHSFFEDSWMSINSPMWTLSVEESFYFIIPFLLILLFAIDKLPHLKTQKQKFVAIALMLFVVHCCFSYLANYIVDVKHLLLGGYDNRFWTGTIFGRFSDFAFGIGAGIFVKKFPNSSLIKNPILANLLFVIGYFGYYLASAHIDNMGGVNAPLAQSSPTYSYAVRSYSLCGAFMILSLYGNSLFAKLFENKVIVYLGQISFALYLCQFVGVFSMGNFAISVKVNAHKIVSHIYNMNYSENFAVVFSYIATSLLAALLYHFVEMPSQKYLRRKFIKSENS